MQGAFVLGIAMVLSKLIGTLQKIPLQNMARGRGFWHIAIPFIRYIR
ncbi:hypothetical protein VQ056_08430 [Paenibacillus sp. JTLBN-2024]